MKSKVENLHFLRMQRIFLFIGYRTLQEPLADRTVLQMAQAAPQDKEILGYYRERSEDTNLCCHLYLPVGHYR